MISIVLRTGSRRHNGGGGGGRRRFGIIERNSCCWISHGSSSIEHGWRIIVGIRRKNGKVVGSRGSYANAVISTTAATCSNWFESTNFSIALSQRQRRSWIHNDCQSELSPARLFGQRIYDDRERHCYGGTTFARGRPHPAAWHRPQQTAGVVATTKTTMKRHLHSSSSSSNNSIHHYPPLFCGPRFGRVVASESQIERTKLIVRHGHGRQWQGIVELFQNERDDYGWADLSTTLSRLAKIHSFPNDHPCLREILSTIANYMDESVIDARHYANICHSIAKLQVHNDRTDDESTDRVVDHLSNGDFVAAFFNDANAQSIANLCWSMAKLNRPDLLRRLICQIDGPRQESLFPGTTTIDEQVVNVTCKPQHVTNIVWACATLGIPAPTLLALVNQHAEWLVSTGKPQEVANTVWACAVLDHHPATASELFAHLEERAEWFVKHGTAQNVANAAWACATLNYAAPTLFAAIDDHAIFLVESANDPQATANTIWAFAKLGHAAPNLQMAVERRFAWLAAHGKPQEIANAIWAYAKLGPRPKSVTNLSSSSSSDVSLLLAAIERRAEWHVVHGTPQNIANVAWACAKLCQTGAVARVPSTYLDAIVHRADWLVQHGSTQNIANTAWAMAKLGHSSLSLFASIASRADWLVENGRPQEIAIVTWACARLGYASPNVFAALERRADWFVGTGSAQAIANAAWACATIGYPSSALFAALEERREWFVTNGNGQNIANAAWACGRLGHALPLFFAAIENRSDWFIANATAPEISNTASACATLGHAMPAFFAALEQRSDWLVSHGDYQAISTTALACATLGHAAPILFRAIDERADWLLANGSSRDVAMTKRAFEMLGCLAVYRMVK